MKNPLDKTAACGLPSACLLKTGNEAATAPVKVDKRNFLCPETKEIPGSAPNILNKGAALRCCFQLPGTISGIPEKKTEYTMNTTPQALSIATHPHDLLMQATHKLHVFNSLLHPGEKGSINLNNPIMANGVYWLLDNICQELSYVANILESKEGIQP